LSASASLAEEAHFYQLMRRAMNSSRITGCSGFLDLDRFASTVAGRGLGFQRLRDLVGGETPPSAWREERINRWLGNELSLEVNWTARVFASAEHTDVALRRRNFHRGRWCCSRFWWSLVFYRRLPSSSAPVLAKASWRKCHKKAKNVHRRF